MYDRVLVPTDGSDATGQVTATAIALARRFDAAVHALYVVDTRPFDGTDLAGDEALERSATAAGQRAVSAVGDPAADADLEVTEAVRTGIPHAEIVTYAEAQAIDLVVMGTRGRTGAELAALGSTAERVLREATVPVVTVRLGEGPGEMLDADDPVDDILVPTDGSDPATRAAEHAVRFADPDATVHALYVVDATIFEFEDAPRSILGTLREGGRNAVATIESVAVDAGLGATTTVAEGTPTEEILDAADEVDAGMIAVGRRGRTGPPTVLLGSTTARVVRLADLPVLSAA